MRILSYPSISTPLTMDLRAFYYSAVLRKNAFSTLFREIELRKNYYNIIMIFIINRRVYLILCFSQCNFHINNKFSAGYTSKIRKIKFTVFSQKLSKGNLINAFFLSAAESVYRDLVEYKSDF